MGARKTITVGEWQGALAKAMQHYKIGRPEDRNEAVARTIKALSEKGELATTANLAPRFPGRDVARAIRQLLAQGRIMRVVATRGNQPAAYVYNPKWKEDGR